MPSTSPSLVASKPQIKQFKTRGSLLAVLRRRPDIVQIIYQLEHDEVVHTSAMLSCLANICLTLLDPTDPPTPSMFHGYLVEYNGQVDRHLSCFLPS